MRVTFLLVAFLAGAHSFKAVERRAKPMGKGGGGVVTRSIVEAAIQTLALDDKIEARHAVNRVRQTFPGVPNCAMNPHVTGGSGSYNVLAGNPPALPFHPSRVLIVAHDTTPDLLEGSHGHMPGPGFTWGTQIDRCRCAWKSLMNRRDSLLQRGIDELLMVFECDSQGAYWDPNNAANGYKEGARGASRNYGDLSFIIPWCIAQCIANGIPYFRWVDGLGYDVATES